MWAVLARLSALAADAGHATCMPDARDVHQTCGVRHARDMHMSMDVALSIEMSACLVKP